MKVDLQGFGTTTKIFTGTNGGAYLLQGNLDFLAPPVQTLDSPNGNEQIIIQMNFWLETPRRWTILKYLGPASTIKPTQKPSLFGLTWGKIGIFLLAGVAVYVGVKQLPQIISKDIKGISQRRVKA